MEPRVSVVVPNYNNACFIGETIESVIRQTYTDWELMVVDDGSTDESWEVVERFIERHPDRNISLVVHPQGPSGTPTPINIGIRHMRGEYFAWLSSDDVFEPEKLEAQVRLLDECPEVGLVHSSYIAIDAKGDTIGEFHPPINFETDVFTALLDGNFINGNTVLIRREVLEDVGPFLETDPEFPEMWRAAEYYYWLQIALRYSIVSIDRLLHRSRRHGGNEEFNSGTMGPALERMFIRRCFESEKLSVTPEIVAAIGGRGLMSLFIQAFGRLSLLDQERAIQLLGSIEGDQERWDYGQPEGVLRLDNSRIRSAFQAGDPERARTMLEALAGLERPESEPYQIAAAKRLATMDRPPETFAG